MASKAVASTLNSTPPLVPISIYNWTSPVGGENLAQRPNGNLVVTVTGAPDLYQIDPSQTGTEAASVIYSFEGYQSLWGIVQPQPDIFYVISANASSPPTYRPPLGTNTLWRIELTSAGDTLSPDPAAIKVSKVVDIREAFTFDGLSLVNAERGLLVTGDAHSGALYVIDVHSHSYDIVFISSQLNETDASDYILDHFGINGIKYFHHAVYYTNSALQTFGRIPISPKTGRVTGDLEVLTNVPRPDDFLIDSKKTALLTELECGLVRYDMRAGKTPNTSLELLFPLPAINAVLWGSGSTACTLYCLFNQGASLEMISGLVQVDFSGSGFKGGLLDGNC